jgi:hypothetical protein
MRVSDRKLPSKLYLSFSGRELNVLSFALLCRCGQIILPFPAPVPGHSAGHRETPEEQIAMITQKIIDAKHPQD